MCVCVRAHASIYQAVFLIDCVPVAVSVHVMLLRACMSVCHSCYAYVSLPVGWSVHLCVVDAGGRIVLHRSPKRHTDMTIRSRRSLFMDSDSDIQVYKYI